MNSLAISAAPFENNEKLENHHNLYMDETVQGILPAQKKNKTIKNQQNHAKSVKKMQAMALNAYNNNEDSEENVDNNDSSELANFSPISPKQKPENEHSSNDELQSIRSYNNLQPTSTDEYYRQFTPKTNSTGNEELLKKLDSILELLEEQSDEKTNYIMEELILYLFLGIFVIFVIDSFVRVGKYVR